MKRSSLPSSSVAMSICLMPLGFSPSSFATTATNLQYVWRERGSWQSVSSLAHSDQLYGDGGGSVPDAHCVGSCRTIFIRTLRSWLCMCQK